MHSVVGAGYKPEKLMNSFKSYATRKLREAKLISDDVKRGLDMVVPLIFGRTRSFAGQSIT